MSLQGKLYCTSCKCHRQPSDFLVNKHGNHYKTCSKHNKKRFLSELDEWDSFIFEINSWSKSVSLFNSLACSNPYFIQVQTRRLDISYNFDLDQIPIAFGNSLEVASDAALDFGPLNEAVNVLNDLIQGASGYRFRQISHYKKSEFAFNYYFACSQDKDRSKPSKATGKRDRCRMERFNCESNLVIKPNLSSRRLAVKLQHNYHTPYLDTRLSQEILGFVNASCLNKTPAEIFRDLLSSEIPGADMVTQHQIYYQWQLANSRAWRLDADQFISTSKFLANRETLYWHEIFTSGNLRAQAIYIRGSISALVSKTQELVIDATFGTNNSGEVERYPC